MDQQPYQTLLANKDKAVLISEAQKTAEEIKGQGDKEAIAKLIKDSEDLDTTTEATTKASTAISTAAKATSSSTASTTSSTTSASSSTKSNTVSTIYPFLIFKNGKDSELTDSSLSNLWSLINFGWKHTYVPPEEREGFPSISKTKTMDGEQLRTTKEN